MLGRLSCAAAALICLTWSARARADDSPYVTPVVRVAMGPSFQVAPEADALTSFALDATAGASALSGLLGGLILNGELGYAFDTRGDDLHAFNLTAGVGYGNVGFGVTLQPRLLLGTIGDELAVGMRNGFVLRGGADALSLEVSHRFLHHDGLSHDIQLLFGVNPAALVYVVATLQDMF
jgi:hypothetical protein